jgi:ring-1,2-phenylacetyl-CoA epoxidase subunit PaaD
VVTVVAQDVRSIVAAVLDPEVPVLTIEDLGILREVRVDEHGHIDVVITPTYSGCPALEAIKAAILDVLHDAGHKDVDVTTVLAPAWTTDWMSAEGKRKLLDYGIAPPGQTNTAGPILVQLGIRCPQCGSLATHEVSHFGSTACKALWVCDSCREPFDHFKPL